MRNQNLSSSSPRVRGRDLSPSRVRAEVSRSSRLRVSRRSLAQGQSPRGGVLHDDDVDTWSRGNGWADGISMSGQTTDRFVAHSRPASSMNAVSGKMHLPHWALCDLMTMKLRDPVLAPDGRSYERSYILRYLSMHDWVLPGSDLKVGVDDLWTDYKLREALSDEDAMAAPTHGRARGDPPEHVLCDIGMDLMREPVLASDGRVYERVTLERIFSERHGRSPFTNDMLKPYGYRHRGIDYCIKALGCLQADDGTSIQEGSAISALERPVESGTLLGAAMVVSLVAPPDVFNWLVPDTDEFTPTEALVVGALKIFVGSVLCLASAVSSSTPFVLAPGTSFLLHAFVIVPLSFAGPILMSMGLVGVMNAVGLELERREPN